MLIGRIKLAGRATKERREHRREAVEDERKENSFPAPSVVETSKAQWLRFPMVCNFFWLPGVTTGYQGLPQVTVRDSTVAVGTRIARIDSNWEN